MKAMTFLSLLLGATEAYGLTVGQTVQTSSGPVNGHAANLTPSVSEYLGIPYAMPPVGSLRFAPPQKYNGTSVINGSSIGFACPASTSFAARGNNLQNYNVSLANLTAQGFATIAAVEQIGATFSEDCLTLNIWVPSGGEAKKAVMVWIYGGGFTTGSTQISVYNGQHLAAQQDVIFVSVNYRVSILGFPGDPAAENRNPGLLDQRMGVEWVRDNIAAFGGDSSRITLFGQSAGSASVDYYTYAWASDPIVSGFIMQSGTANFGATAAPSNPGWYNVTATLGCGTNVTSNSSAILSCMQTKDVWAILDAMGTYSFGPTADNITVFSNYTSLARDGKFTRLPTLVGNNDFEAGVFIALDALVNETYSPQHWDSFSNMFACSSGTRANASFANGVLTWRYRWFGNFPNTRLYTDPDSGAYHGSEMPFIFDTLPSGPGIPEFTAAEVSIAAYIQGAWAAFAKNNSGGLETYQGGWPSYTPFGDTLVRLGWNNQTGTNAASPSIYDSVCSTTFQVSAGNSTNTSSSSTATASLPASFTSSATALDMGSWGLLITLLVAVFYGWLV